MLTIIINKEAVTVHKSYFALNGLQQNLTGCKTARKKPR